MKHIKIILIEAGYLIDREKSTKDNIVTKKKENTEKRVLGPLTDFMSNYDMSVFVQEESGCIETKRGNLFMN